LNDLFAGTEVIPFNSLEDALYIGSDLPFNHRHIEMTVTNAQIANWSVSSWNGSLFIPCVDVIDLTKTLGTTTLGQSGILAWTPDRQKSWFGEDTTENMKGELSTLKIYNLYWVKLTLSANLSVTTEIKYVGHKFSNDADLEAQYPDFADSNFKMAFKSGKTNWIDQTILASEMIIQDLRKSRVIMSSSQILDWREFAMASVHKTAEIVFRAMGDDYKDQLKTAQAAYKAALESASNLDGNLNATIDPKERANSVGYFSR